MVEKEKFGERHVCYACACKFYDMHRPKLICPRCGADVSHPPKAGTEVPEAPEIDEEVGEEEILDMPEEKVSDLESDPEVGQDEEEAEADDI